MHYCIGIYKTKINSKKIYSGLSKGFQSKGIAEYSDSFTKAWNYGSDTQIKDSEKIEVIKYLCLYNNFAVDYAKTLYKPKENKLPERVRKNLDKMVGKEYPYFFKYKIKEDSNTKYPKSIRNKKISTIDKLEEIII